MKKRDFEKERDFEEERPLKRNTLIKRSPLDHKFIEKREDSLLGDNRKCFPNTFLMTKKLIASFVQSNFEEKIHFYLVVWGVQFNFCKKN